MSKKTKKTSKFKRFLGILGPGLITGASDDDPSGIATYSQAGAQYGFATLWTALVTFPLMASVQEMCARIGIATSRGLTSVLKDYYPRWVLYTMIFFSFPAIILNIGADIEGMGAVANLICPRISTGYFSILFTLILLVFIVFLPYRRIAEVLKFLTAILLVYLLVPFIAKTNWLAVIESTFVPHVHFNLDYISILVAILGTTISPYLFFWQADMEVEELREGEKKHDIMLVSRKMFLTMRTDVNFGMFFSNLVMFFIILTTGSVLAGGGIHSINTVEDAAVALKPLAGDMAYYLFAAGVVGTGLLAIPVLSAAVAYIFAETFELKRGLDKKFHEAKGFYAIIGFSLIVGLCLNYAGISPIKALLYSAILYGLTAPVIIAVILHICNNKVIMGKHVNRLRANVLGGITFVLMAAAAVLLLYYQFFSAKS